MTATMRLEKFAEFAIGFPAAGNLEKIYLEHGGGFLALPGQTPVGAFLKFAGPQNRVLQNKKPLPLGAEGALVIRYRIRTCR
jgi:hypothetical protein